MLNDTSARLRDRPRRNEVEFKRLLGPLFVLQVHNLVCSSSIRGDLTCTVLDKVANSIGKAAAVTFTGEASVDQLCSLLMVGDYAHVEVFVLGPAADRGDSPPDIFKQHVGVKLSAKAF